ncbi:hypothetical protein [Flavobacterium branchiicola]|uniref:Uncharacterized protein n=1 Tax=Flavobacterium branchiicola TaxID=1114875 RepID=A0ABV9PG41_9FLAO|nr:hypothetical protein [Flavobacterium branchiicola]MBS7255736.1 hypothetical protein [Flavobacterium branchiicola]
MSKEKFPGPIHVPVSTAKAWEKKYDDDSSIEERGGKDKVKAFLIPRESLKKVLKLKTDAVFAYIGINDDNEKTLLFVGAKLNPLTGKYENVYGPPENGDNAEGGEEVAYDGARPCPPY